MKKKFQDDLFHAHFKNMTLGRDPTKEHLSDRNCLCDVHFRVEDKFVVNLAVQTISASVADALEFLMVDVCDPNFAGAKATIEFIRIVDRAFDLLNSRNPFGKGYETPMKPETEKVWRPLLE
ncbi:hypothetical protein JTB14_023934 [Gonioctena quinquepunctata]|nr:hypothetical protein JTB14_023934 [Gonioctena quinquepunctata]